MLTVETKKTPQCRRRRCYRFGLFGVVCVFLIASVVSFSISPNKSFYGTVEIILNGFRVNELTEIGIPNSIENIQISDVPKYVSTNIAGIGCNEMNIFMRKNILSRNPSNLSRRAFIGENGSGLSKVTDGRILRNMFFWQREWEDFNLSSDLNFSCRSLPKIDEGYPHCKGMFLIKTTPSGYFSGNISPQLSYGSVSGNIILQIRDSGSSYGDCQSETRKKTTNRVFFGIWGGIISIVSGWVGICQIIPTRLLTKRKLIIGVVLIVISFVFGFISGN